MSSTEMQNKYQKYKLKYINLKQNGGVLPVTELTPDILMAIIILYNKTLFIYTLYRFRYDNTKNLIDITDLSNKIFSVNQNKVIKDQYKLKYIDNLLSLPDDKITELIKEPSTPFSPNRLVFTLRKDTATVIRHLFLINNESIKVINDYINLLERHNLIAGQYSELYGKCLQIRGLVVPGTTPVLSNQELTELDVIRNESSKIINIIGDDYDNTIMNQGHKANNLSDDKNELLDELFNKCFKGLSKILENYSSNN